MKTSRTMYLPSRPDRSTQIRWSRTLLVSAEDLEIGADETVKETKGRKVRKGVQCRPRTSRPPSRGRVQ